MCVYRRIVRTSDGQGAKAEVPILGKLLHEWRSHTEHVCVVLVLVISHAFRSVCVCGCVLVFAQQIRKILILLAKLENFRQVGTF